MLHSMYSRNLEIFLDVLARVERKFLNQLGTGKYLYI